MRIEKLIMRFEGPCGLTHIAVTAEVDFGSQTFSVFPADGEVEVFSIKGMDNSALVTGYCGLITRAAEECEKLLDRMRRDDGAHSMMSSFADLAAVLDPVRQAKRG